MPKFYMIYSLLVAVAFLGCIADGSGNTNERNGTNGVDRADVGTSPYGAVFERQYGWDNIFWERFECVCHYEYYEFSNPQECAGWYTIEESELDDMVYCIDLSSQEYGLSPPPAYIETFNCLNQAYYDIESCEAYLQGDVCSPATEEAFTSCEEEAFAQIGACEAIAAEDPASQDWIEGLEERFAANDCFAYFE